MSVKNSDYDIGGTFMFGDVLYTTCNVSSNGFIFFGNVNDIFTYNPFSDISWKTVAPFAGDLQPADENPVVIVKSNNSITFTFNCYSRFNVKINLLQFSLTLYLSNHQTKPNQIDFDYISSEFRDQYYSQNYYIGYCDGKIQKYLGDVDNLNSFSYGGLNITSKNIFPKNRTKIENVTNISTNKILCGSTNGLAYGIPLGLSSNDTFNYFGTMYTNCNISSNGYIFFGTGPISSTISLFSNLTWNIIVPFGGYLITTLDGIELTYGENMLTITFNCYSMYGLQNNVLKFSVIFYLNNNIDKPNQIDFEYISSVSQSTNFRNDYYIGYCGGNQCKSIFDVNGMYFINGSSTIQSNNKFPSDGTILKNITNIITTADTCLVSCYDTIKPNVEIGGTFKFGINEYTTFNLSTNGFIYFDTNETYPPNDSVTNPFVNDKWIIIAPFCGKFRTTNNGILIKRELDKCTIKWTCYSYSGSLSNIISFYLKLYLDGTNKFEFDYDQSSAIINRDCYVGFCNGITQNWLNEFDSRIFPEGSHIFDEE